MLPRIRVFCVLVAVFAQGCLCNGTEEIGRVKRGASVYPVFAGANSGGSGAEQNSYLFLHDATPFIQYLGGSTGSGSSHSGGGQSSSYSFRVQAPPGTTHSGPLENNYVNSFNRHSSSQPSMSPSPSSSGWNTAGYAGPVFIPYFGLTSPNFANNGQSPATSYSQAPRPEVHTLDASALLHTAQSSFNAQTAYFNALTGGSRPRQYKGGYKK